jgi:multiple sugar transport system ATP-binding protein
MEIYKKPANKFVAGFIGSPPMNFLEGRIVKKGELLYFNEARSELKVPDNFRQQLSGHVNREMILGIRPEDIYDRIFISEAAPENNIKAFLEVIEPMGVETHLYLKTGRNRFIAKVPSSQKPGSNQDMELVFDMSKASFFDKDTQKTIV